MRTLTLAVAAGALLVATQANAGSFPISRLTGAESGLVDQVAVRVYAHEGRRLVISYFNIAIEVFAEAQQQAAEAHKRFPFAEW
jgi:hypothetical protein